MKLSDLAPDDVRMVVDWANFKPGTSFFVPAIDLYEVVAQVRRVCDEHRWDVKHTVRIEDGRQGVRFWRVV